MRKCWLIDILERVKATSRKLQDPKLDFNAAVAMVVSLKRFLDAKRETFTEYERHRPLSRRLDRCDRVIQKESGDPNGGNMCSFSWATGTSRVRHNADYVPCAQIRFDLYVRESPASPSIANGVFAIRAYGATLVLSCHMYWPTLQWSQTVRDGAHGLV